MRSRLLMPTSMAPGQQRPVQFLIGMRLDQHVETRVPLRCRESPRSAAAPGRPRSAGWRRRRARASMIWYSSMMKSFRRSGRSTAFLIRPRYSRSPWKYFFSVRTERQAAPDACIGLGDLRPGRNPRGSRLSTARPSSPRRSAGCPSPVKAPCRTPASARRRQPLSLARESGDCRFVSASSCFLYAMISSRIMKLFQPRMNTDAHG